MSSIKENKPTPEEIEIEEKCKNGVQQKLNQAIADADAKAAEAAAEAAQAVAEAQAKLAKIPEEIIEGLDKTIKTLMSIIGGYEDPGLPDFDPDKIIADIKSCLDPVIQGLSSLPVPSIPGLNDITSLLDKLSQISASKSTMSEDDIKKMIPDKPEFPSKLMTTLNDLLTAVQSLCTTLPMVMVNLIFSMVDVIVSNFKMIQSAIGVPPIPPPLDKVPDCIALGPKILKLITNLPTQLTPTVQGVVRKKYQEIAAMKLPPKPTPPAETPIPESYPTCPEHT